MVMIPPNWERPLKIWHLVLSIMVVCLGGMFTAAAAWSNVQNRLENVEAKTAGIERMERNIVRIGATLKIEGLEVPR
jgi:hypothetical protein